MPDGAQRVGARLAVSFALFLALAETARNWGNWQWWPFWLVDYIASALLLAGGLSTLRRAGWGPRWLAGGWGFASAMFYMSFWSHIEELERPADGNLAQTPLTIAIGVLWVLTLVGLALSLVGARDAVAGERA